MALADFAGAGLAALGRYKVIVPASQTTTQITAPNLKEGDALTDGHLDNTGLPVKRFCRITCATGTGAITVYEAVDSGHCDAAHTIWSRTTTVAGDVFSPDIPLAAANSLFITTAASTTCVVNFN